MKRVLFLGLLAMLLGFSSLAYGQDLHVQGAYIGIGGSYAFEDFDVDSEYVNGSVLDYDFDDAFGFNLTLGYRANEMLALELAFDHFFEFDYSDSFFISGVTVNGDSELEITTFMAVAKLSPGLGSEKARLFIVAVT